jgi:hypothetical protein
VTTTEPDGRGHRPFGSDPEAEDLVRAFRDCVLPKPAWTHRAHLTAALWYLDQHDGPGALEAMRAAIRRFNDSVGTANTATNGYHETITVLYLRVVAAWRRELGPGLGLAERANRLYLELGDRDLPLRYYSRERLMSVEARARWVEPDKEPLPEW